MHLRYTEEAQRILQANVPPRSRRLDRLERYSNGTQYEGRADFWNDDVPLFERAPCIVYPIVGAGIRSVVDMVLGEGRWPEITARSDEDASVNDPQFGLDEDSSEKVNALVRAVVEQAKLKLVCDDALSSALATGTAVAIVCARKGKLCVDVTLSKWCRPKFAPDGSLTSIEIRYPYLDEYKDRDGQWAVRVMLYRRVIDESTDVTYKPALANEHGDEPAAWYKDQEFKHGFGFCPVIWYAYDRRVSTVAQIDGHAIHNELLQKIDCLNFSLSQEYAAAMVGASPPVCEFGVSEADQPAAVGRLPEIVIPSGQAPDGTIHPSYTTGKPRKPARKRGPGQVWQYDSKDARVETLVLPGDALKPITDSSRSIRSKIEEAMSIVLLDIDNAKFSSDLSGKAMARLYDRQVRLCDRVRSDFGDGFLLPLVCMLLRVALRLGDSVYLGPLKNAAPILARFDGEEWTNPTLDLAWGVYFEPDAADEQAIVTMVTGAQQAGLITKRTAVQSLSEIFDIGSVDEYLESLEEEAEENQKKSLENTEAMATISAKAGIKPAFEQKPVAE